MLRMRGPPGRARRRSFVFRSAARKLSGVFRPMVFVNG
jgi:hypothetical protein